MKKYIIYTVVLVGIVTCIILTIKLMYLMKLTSEQNMDITAASDSQSMFYIGDNGDWLVKNPNNNSITYAYPTLYVNGNYYEWRRANMEGKKAILVLANSASYGSMPSNPNSVLDDCVYYGSIIHYSGDYQCPIEDREMVSWFDVHGDIYIDSSNDETVYLYIETEFWEYAVIAFDKIDKPR